MRPIEKFSFDVVEVLVKLWAFPTRKMNALFSNDFKIDVQIWRIIFTLEPLLTIRVQYKQRACVADLHTIRILGKKERAALAKCVRVEVALLALEVEWQIRVFQA